MIRNIKKMKNQRDRCLEVMFKLQDKVQLFKVKFLRHLVEMIRLKVIKLIKDID